VRADKLYINAPEDCSREQTVAALQGVMAAIPTIVVSGVPTIGRAVVQRSETKGNPGQSTFSLVVEGTNFR